MHIVSIVISMEINKRHYFRSGLLKILCHGDRIRQRHRFFSS